MGVDIQGKPNRHFLVYLVAEYNFFNFDTFNHRNHQSNCIAADNFFCWQINWFFLGFIIVTLQQYSSVNSLKPVMSLCWQDQLKLRLKLPECQNYFTDSLACIWLHIFGNFFGNCKRFNLICDELFGFYILPETVFNRMASS